MKQSMICLYHLSDQLLVEQNEGKRSKIIKKINSTIKKNLFDFIDNSEERIDIEVLTQQLTEDNYGYMIPKFMVIMSRYFSKLSTA